MRLSPATIVEIVSEGSLVGLKPDQADRVLRWKRGDIPEAELEEARAYFKCGPNCVGSAVGQSCGKEIPKSRLKALPLTNRCEDCDRARIKGRAKN